MYGCGLLVKQREYHAGAEVLAGGEGTLAGDLFADNAVEEVDDGAAVEFGAGLVRIVQNIFLFFQKS